MESNERDCISVPHRNSEIGVSLKKKRKKEGREEGREGGKEEQANISSFK